MRSIKKKNKCQLHSVRQLAIYHVNKPSVVCQLNIYLWCDNSDCLVSLRSPSVSLLLNCPTPSLTGEVSILKAPPQLL